MSKFFKVSALGLGAVMGLGAIGSACYQFVPGVKNKVDNVIHKNASVKIDKKDDTKIDNPSEVEPITPGEFKSKYKVEIPTSFTGDLLYVKQLKNNDLLISSEIATSILYYKKDSNTTSQVELSFSSWKYFEEMENGDVLIGSSKSDSGLIRFYHETGECKRIYNSYNFGSFVLLNSGKYLIKSLSYPLFLLTVETNKIEEIGSYSGSDIIGLIELSEDKFILSSGNNYYYFNYSTMSKIKSLKGSVGGNLLKLYQDEEKLYFCSTYGLFKFAFSTETIEEIGDYNLNIKANSYYFDFHFINGTKRIWIMGDCGFSFDISDFSIEVFYSQKSYYKNSLLFDLENGNKLILLSTRSGSSGYYDYYLYDSSTNTLNLLRSQRSDSKILSFSYEKFSNGILFLSSFSSSSGFYPFWFDFSDNTLKEIKTSEYSYGGYFTKLNNGKILICIQNSVYYLSLFNPVDQTFKTIAKLDKFENFEENEDGTVLIKTGQTIDYEYDYRTDTLRLVYTVEE